MPAALSPALSPTCLLRGLRSGVSLASWEAGRAPGCQGASRGRSGGWCRRTAGADGGRGARSVFIPRQLSPPRSLRVVGPEQGLHFVSP